MAYVITKYKLKNFVGFMLINFYSIFPISHTTIFQFIVISSLKFGLVLWFINIQAMPEKDLTYMRLLGNTLLDEYY